jgi:DNA-directed RNA polymerase specialized sigma24 family protein
MHAPAAAETRTSWRHPQGDARTYFDSERAAQWIEDWNKQGNMDSLNRLLIHARPLIESICEYRATTKHEELAELVQLCQIKLWRSARLFDPSRGSAFSFVARVVSSVSASIVADAWRRGERFVSLEEVRRQTMGENAYTLEDRDLAPFQATPADQHALEHIEFLVRSVRTTLTDPEELSAGRWIILSLAQCGFGLARHQVADSAMKVFNLTHHRARQVHDLLLVSLRRGLLNGIERRLVPIRPRDIVRTRLAALEKFAPLLSPEEFTKLCVLLRDLAPATVFLMRPENALKILRGDSAAARENLRLLLDGDPSSRPLFV